MQLSLQLSKLQGTTSYFDGNMGRVGVKSDTVNRREQGNAYQGHQGHHLLTTDAALPQGCKKFFRRRGGQRRRRCRRRHRW
jgi:hypothetical protein